MRLTHSVLRFGWSVLFLLLCCLASPALYAQQAPPASSATPGALFIENKGQFDPQIRFQLYGGAYGVQLTADGIWVTAAGEPAMAAAGPVMSPADPAAYLDPTTRPATHLRLAYTGANANPQLLPFARQAASINYFRGSDPAAWQTNVPVWHGVRYRNLYPGFDLEVTVRNGRLTQQLIAQPGADAATIAAALASAQLEVHGNATVAVDGTALAITTAVGTILVERPQVILPTRQAAARVPVVDAQGRAAATVDSVAATALAATQPLTDTTLLYSTFLGGGDNDQAYDLATASDGTQYLTGRADSADFPATVGDTTLGGDADLFVAKVAPNGNGTADLIYATFLGGGDSDGAIALVVDDGGQVTLVGSTRSPDFPTTAGAYQSALRGRDDSVVVTLNAAGNGLAYATYLGGNGDDVSQALALMPDGQLIMVGATTSTNFPVTAGAIQTQLAGGNPAFGDAFIARLDPTMSGAAQLTYGTYLGGERKENALAVAVDPNGLLHLAGKTDSGNFPTTTGAFDRSYNGLAELRYDDAFVAKVAINPDGSSQLRYATYLGGNDSDDARAIAVDAAGALYVTGQTISANFPTTPGAFDTSYNGGTSATGGDAYVVKLTADGSRLEYATFFGGDWYELGHDLAIDSVGRVYLTGETNSANLPMPVTAFDPDYTPTVLRYYDAFLARFSPDGSALTYATYLGDAGVDIAHALTLGAENRVSLAGWTSSLHFPTTPGAFDTGYNDGGFFTDPYDAFVTTLQLPPPPAATYRIAGRILDTNGLAVANVRVDLVGEGIAVGRFATTDGNGTFALADLAAGAYTVSPRKDGFAFEPRSRAVSVPPNAIAQDFVMRSDQSAGLKPPLLVVHGFQGFSSKPITCTAVPEQFVGDPLRTTLDDLPSWFYADDEYDVYLARLDSGPAYTASIDANALCLFQQIAALYDAAGRQPITIVAHSMGGLVSRTCLAYAGCREKVAALYTLGSPHGGLNYNFLLRLYLATNWEIAEQGICLLQSPLCQFATDQMAFFNLYTPNQDGIRYGFIAGDETPLFPGALIFPTDGPNDGVVSTNSALGYVPLLGTPFPADWLDSDPPVVQFVTDESHFGFFGNGYHENRAAADGGTTAGRSQSYACLRYLLTGNPQAAHRDAPDVCRAPSEVRSAADQPTLQTTSDITGTLVAGDVVTHTVRVDANSRAIFSLFWTTGTVTLDLLSPTGTPITPPMALADGTGITYTATATTADFLRTASYGVTSAEPGLWQLQIRRAATDSDQSTTRYVGFVTLESPLLLSLTRDAQSYQPGATATFTATLRNDSTPVAGATISATLHLPDGSTDLLTFTETVSGTYRTTYRVPTAGGGVVMTVVAAGAVAGVPFSRQSETVWSITPAAVEIGRAITDRTVDHNVDSIADELLVSVPLSVSVPATYTFHAGLAAGDTTIVGAVAVFSATTPGDYRVALHFAGAAIGAAGIDGPYQVRNAVLLNPALGNVPVLSVPLLHTTAAYRAEEFGQQPQSSIYLPLIRR